MVFCDYAAKKKQACAKTLHKLAFFQNFLWMVLLGELKETDVFVDEVL